MSKLKMLGIQSECLALFVYLENDSFKGAAINVRQEIRKLRI